MATIGFHYIDIGWKFSVCETPKCQSFQRANYPLMEKKMQDHALTRVIFIFIFFLGVFVGLGLSGVVPTLHFVISEGLIKATTMGQMGWLLLMATLYITGACLYAARIPERFFPGKCDIWVSKQKHTQVPHREHFPFYFITTFFFHFPFPRPSHLSDALSPPLSVCLFP